MRLPDEVAIVRTTPVFTVETVPPGLLHAHRSAPGVWGLIRVITGTVTFAQEASGESRPLSEGDEQVIEPEVPHHVEPGSDSSFLVEFYR